METPDMRVTGGIHRNMELPRGKILCDNKALENLSNGLVMKGIETAMWAGEYT